MAWQVPLLTELDDDSLAHNFHIQNNYLGDWRDSSVAKNTCNCFTGPEFSSQHSLRCLQLLVFKLQDIRLPLLVSGCPQASGHVDT